MRILKRAFHWAIMFFGWIVFCNLFRAEVLLWGMNLIVLIALESLLTTLFKMAMAVDNVGLRSWCVVRKWALNKDGKGFCDIIIFGSRTFLHFH